MTVPLNSLFEVTYGSKLDLNKMVSLAKPEGINFVGRSSRNHGVSGAIAPIKGLVPFPSGAITVALGGTKLLTSFVQLETFYTAQNVAVLREKMPMTMAQKLYICLCIRHNRFRYSAFGREANRTLRTLPVPSLHEFPDWVLNADVTPIDVDLSSPAVAGGAPSLLPNRWKEFRFSEIFEIKKGKRLTKAHAKAGDTPFISAIDKNNGLRQRVSAPALHPSGLITVNYNGSVAEAFYQPEPFLASDDVNVLYPKFQMNEFTALFICTIIRRERYRFSYGRKWKLERMKESIIRLPATSSGLLDVNWMETFMQKLPYSSALLNVHSDDKSPARSFAESS